MSNSIGPYQVIDLSPGRRAWINTLDLSGPSHRMTALLEVDVTVPRQVISEYYKRTGEKLSFTGYLTYCLANAIQENKEVQAYLKGCRQLVLFEDVNVGIMVEKQAGEKRVLMGHVIQAAQNKSYMEIHREIRQAQSEPAPATRGMPGWFRWIMKVPWPFSKLVKAAMGFVTNRNPAIRVATSGTVVVTSVGMFGKGHSGWGIASLPVSLSLIVGSMTLKPAVVEGRVKPRHILNLSVIFDHDVVDGAPAARFTQRLLELIETGSGLETMDQF